MLTPRIGSWKFMTLCSVIAALSTAPLRAGDDDHKSHRDHDKTTTSSSATESFSKDTKFAQEALEGNQSEVAMAELAVRKAQNQELKSFAQHLRQDHTAAAQQLRPIAQRLGVDANQEVKGKHEKILTRLQRLEEQEFDREFAKVALQDHKKDIEEYQKASTQVQDAQLKQYITQTLPKLQQHMQHALQVAQTVGVDRSTLAEFQRSMSGSTGASEQFGTGTSSTGTGTSTDAVPKTSKGAGAKQLKDGHHSEE